MFEKSDTVFRFAPSPTGYLHVGGARTAIFNWLTARAQKGKFLLRIEDTDQERSTEQSVRQILDSLTWLGIDWDEAPLYQSHQAQRHKEVAQELLKTGEAYRCFCTQNELNRKREYARKAKQNIIYDGTCKNLSQSQIQQSLDKKLPYSIRLKVENSFTEFTDDVHGKIRVANNEFGDFVIIRSDGSPIYQLAVVVDDHDMGVTHVLRGDDHISNTPKQILLYRAMKWSEPQFGHLPLILGPDKVRLSKRHGAASVEEFKAHGILADALFNYLCLLGWAPGDDREIMTREELISQFSLERVNKSNAVFDYQKLLWMNSKYLADIPDEDLLEMLSYLLSPEQLSRVNKDRSNFLNLLGLLKIRAKTLLDIVDSSLFFFSDPEEYDPKGVEKYFTPDNSLELLQGLRLQLMTEEQFNSDTLEIIVRKQADTLGISAGKLIHPLRLALTGRTISPGIFELMSILGKETVSERISRAEEYIKNLAKEYIL